MYHACRYISSLFLAAALATPAAIMAMPEPQNASVQVRIYDRDHKDYHVWDDREDRAYGQYRSENPRSAHEFSKASKRQQSQYWNWRHSHPDKD
jgi:CHAT domain-containing protein